MPTCPRPLFQARNAFLGDFGSSFFFALSLSASCSLLPPRGSSPPAQPWFLCPESTSCPSFCLVPSCLRGRLREMASSFLHSSLVLPPREARHGLAGSSVQVLPRPSVAAYFFLPESFLPGWCPPRLPESLLAERMSTSSLIEFSAAFSLLPLVPNHKMASRISPACGQGLSCPTAVFSYACLMDVCHFCRARLACRPPAWSAAIRSSAALVLLLAVFSKQNDAAAMPSAKKRKERRSCMPAHRGAGASKPRCCRAAAEFAMMRV